MMLYKISYHMYTTMQTYRAAQTSGKHKLSLSFTLMPNLL